MIVDNSQQISQISANYSAEKQRCEKLRFLSRLVALVFPHRNIFALAAVQGGNASAGISFTHPSRPHE